jgi:glyoxylase-like metal-dependent hydrolase (beta-lactamase superfamily II)
MSSVWVCPACGANYAPTPSPPERCPLCEDERQWVPPDGQQWVSFDELVARGYATEVREVEPGLTGIGTEPEIGVGQRGLLVATRDGNVLWDPPGFIDDAAIDAVRRAGGLRVITSSHPHMYGAAVEWSQAFDAEIVLPEADVRWLARDSDRIRTWSGTLALLDGVTLVQCGGHFPGSSVLHWEAGAGGDGVLLCGDTLFVAPGEDRVSFIWSAPNHLPLSERAVRGIAEAVSPYAFERVYGGWWTPVVRHDGADVVRRSARRYIELLRGAADEQG